MKNIYIFTYTGRTEYQNYFVSNSSSYKKVWKEYKKSNELKGFKLIHVTKIKTEGINKIENFLL